MKNWSDCKQILIIRADNMGDVLMSSPAIRAVYESFNAELTLLTSSRGAEVARLLREITNVITFDLPWVKADQQNQSAQIFELVEVLKQRRFDGCIIFTVYSQNPMPAAMIAYLADIPLCLAYCRENPYHLLSHWVPDDEPYLAIKHQVARDLNLVAAIGVTTKNTQITLELPASAKNVVAKKIEELGLTEHEFIILHPGVSEKKRQYPLALWATCAKRLIAESKCKIVLTGTANEAVMLNQLAQSIGSDVYSTAGMFSVAELAELVDRARLVVAVNTGITHLAAAVQTPVVVLYAQTNPQHHPWQATTEVLEFSVPQSERSRNEVIRYVNDKLYQGDCPLPTADDIVMAVKKLLNLHT